MASKKFYSKVKVKFNDGSEFVGDEIDVALVAGFTAQFKGGVMEILYIESELMPDVDEDV